MQPSNTTQKGSDDLLPEQVEVDVGIVGGGIAGLWLLNLLCAKGYNAVLFEADQLGCEQTLASQGMIHGGLKYTLGGSLSAASEAIAGMPERWRACLDGQGEVDLSGLEPLSEHYYLYAEGNSLGKLTTFFASRMLRGRIERLSRHQFPPGLNQFDGVVYALKDFVLDTPRLLARLLQPVGQRVYRQRVDSTNLHESDQSWQIRLPSDKIINIRQLLLAAGAGSGQLLAELGISKPEMQLRPLHQVIARHPDLQPLYAHCLTGVSRAEPRLTITSHPDPDHDPDHEQRWLWYLGGALATSGVNRNSAQQIDHARAELRRCAPWIDWQQAQMSTLRCDRAEPRQRSGRRPDEAFVERIHPRALVCWPTKLSLAPDLGDRVLSQLSELGKLDPPEATRVQALDAPAAQIGRPPWLAH